MTATPTTPTPDWSRIPFDVSCARCGHDLKGLTNPKCPACELTFDWAEAVPVEELLCERCGYRLFGLTDTRCPECGETFAWDEAFAARHRRKTPLFEFQWRQRFTHSFLVSMRWAMNPTRLWQTAKLHDMPRIGSLFLLALLWMVAAWVMILLASTTNEWQVNRWTALPPGYAWLLAMSRMLSRVMPFVVGVGIVWWVSGLISLMIFRQSMRRYKVRFGHVLRVWCYSGMTVFLVIPLMVVVATALYVASERVWLPKELDVIVMDLLVPGMFWTSLILSLAFVAWSLRCGYKHYMRMDHPLSVAVASQVIAVLGTATVFVATRF